MKILETNESTRLTKAQQWDIIAKKYNIYPETKVSEYFTAKECLVSATGDANNVFNIPTKKQWNSIHATCLRADDVRKYLGVPLITLSVFRSQYLNAFVKGSATSAHKEGRALDIYSNKMAAKTIYDKLVDAIKNKELQFDQVIYYPKQNFVHIGFKADRDDERNQYWVQQ